MKRPTQGFTLLELLITLAVSSIILTLAVPSFQGLMERSYRQAEISKLIGLLNLARNTAISEGTSVTVCALDNDNKCSRDWTLPIVAFRDPERTRHLAADTQTIRVLEPSPRGHFTANSGIRDYFRFRSSGMAREAIGNIVWCPKSLDLQTAMQLRINMGGRIQTSRDINGDGVVEGANGQPISCP